MHGRTICKCIFNQFEYIYVWIYIIFITFSCGMYVYPLEFICVSGEKENN